MSRWKNLSVYFIVICLIVDQFSGVIEAKKIGGGGWFGRGGSRSMPRQGPTRILGGHTGRSSFPVVGGYGRRTGGGFGVGRSMLTGALAGLAAGYVGTRIGRAMAGGWYHGRYYHFGDRYYGGPGPNRVRCTIVTPDDFSMQYDDGRRVRELIYECDRYRETCCVDGCCPRRW